MNVEDSATRRQGPRPPDDHQVVDSDRPDGGDDQQAGQGGHGYLAHHAGEKHEDDKHPQPGEDRRPAGTGAGGHVERRLANGAADRLALEEPGGDIAHSLGDEVTIRVRGSAVDIRRRLAHARALHEHDGGHCEGAGNQFERQVAERRERWKGQPLRHCAEILDPLYAGQAGHAHDQRRHDQGDQSGEGAQALHAAQ